MNNAKGFLKVTALLALMNGVVYLLSSAIAGFAVVPLVTGGVWLLLAAGLMARQRWVAYFAFLLALASAITEYATLAAGEFSVWISMSIVAISVLLVVVSFLVIWRHPQRKSSGRHDQAAVMIKNE